MLDAVSDLLSSCLDNVQRRAEQRLARAKAAPAPKPAATPPKRKRSASVEVSDDEADEGRGDDAAEQVHAVGVEMLCLLYVMQCGIVGTFLLHGCMLCGASRG